MNTVSTAGGAYKLDTTYEEFYRKLLKIRGANGIFRVGLNNTHIDKEIFDLAEKSRNNPHVQEILPWFKEDIEYESEEDLYKQLAEKYDMEDLRQGDLTKILKTLDDAGVLEPGEFILACSPIPITGTSEMPYYQPGGVKNAFTDYRETYADYISRYCQNVSPATAKKLQDAMAVHNKVDAILHTIQGYRNI